MLSGLKDLIQIQATALATSSTSHARSMREFLALIQRSETQQNTESMDCHVRAEGRGKRITEIYNLAVIGLKSFFEAAPSKDFDLDTPSRSNYP